MSDEQSTPRPEEEQRFSAAEQEALSAWQAPLPPPDLASRVLPRVPVARPRSRRARRAVLGALALAATLLLALGLWSRLQPPASGAAQVISRTTIDIGRRATAVAESGAELSWRVERNGAATVHQRAGEVFFRVEHGGPFKVITPRGTVSVLGTCFRVEVREMKASRAGLTGAAAGAALATLVVVSVYEGKVLTAAPGGQAAVGPGQVATLAARGPVQVVDPRAHAEAARPGQGSLSSPSGAVNQRGLPAGDQSASAPELAAEANRLREQVRTLQEEVRTLKGDQRPAKFFAPSKEELLAMANQCEVRFDMPSMGLEPSLLSKKKSEEIGLSADETELVNKTLAQTYHQITDKVRLLYAEATGDTKGAESLAVSAMMWEIDDKSQPAERKALFRRLAQERAGLRSPPVDLASLSPRERLYRYLTGLGDALENKLGEQIGPDLARRYREEQGNGFESRYMHKGCP